ncbi:MAG TPA: peptidylprolyl isomerase [Burkholderiales bacterium]|nr:peptidylprolyl isomerase [Burkholderiales bacterium]
METKPQSLDDLRALLLKRASELGLEPGSEDEVLERLLDLEVRTPEPTDEECRRYYERNIARFSSGDLAEASHILFAITPRVPPGALRAKAAEVHAMATKDPSRFADLASQYSNCPSAAQGGSLGQVGRGDTVPEFDAALFEDARLGVLPDLVTTRHGFHVVRVARRIAGRPVPFEEARATIGAFLRERSTERALAQYLRILAEGASPLVQ